jgi:hypothetical protein
MKIRNGFVSNSSSSSFVLLGFEVNYHKDPMGVLEIIRAITGKPLEDSMDEINDLLYSSVDGAVFDGKDRGGHRWTYIHMDQGQGYIGLPLAHGSNYMDSGSLSMDQLVKLIGIMREKVPMIQEIKLHWGEHSC